MRIGFDAKRLFLNHSGLGNYSRWLLDGLQKYELGNEYHLFTTALNHNDSSIQNQFQDGSYNIHLPLQLFKGFWRSKGIKKDLLKLDIKIYHGLSNEIPFGIENTNIKTVVTIHDLIFKLYPQFYPLIDRKIYERKFRSACERADKIVAVSAHTKNLIVQYYKIPENKIEVIYMDANPMFLNLANAEDLERCKKEFKIKNPFFLNVGSYGGRKNQLRLLDAFARISKNVEQDLVFVGKKTADYGGFEKKIKEHKLTDRVHWFENVSDQNLYLLYQLSYATVYPSIYEGFGIPIVESYRSGKPVLTSIGSSLEEISGQAGLLCNPLEIDDISEKLEALASINVYKNLSDNISNELKRFDTPSLMKQYQNLYSKLKA